MPIAMGTVEDAHHGDLVCTGCGCVLGPVIDFSPVKRVYEKDDAAERASKTQHTVYDDLLDDSIRSCNFRLDAEDEFLHEGYKAIDMAMNRLFPDINHYSAQRLAKFYFKQAFKQQQDEKKGISQMKRKTPADAGLKRMKFSRRKAFIVSSILAALRQENITKITKDSTHGTYYDVGDLNPFVEGKKVSPSSKIKCWKELNISFDDEARTPENAIPNKRGRPPHHDSGTKKLRGQADVATESVPFQPVVPPV